MSRVPPAALHVHALLVTSQKLAPSMWSTALLSVDLSTSISAGPQLRCTSRTSSSPTSTPMISSLQIPFTTVQSPSFSQTPTPILVPSAQSHGPNQTLPTTIPPITSSVTSLPPKTKPFTGSSPPGPHWETSASSSLMSFLILQIILHHMMSLSTSLSRLVSAWLAPLAARRLVSSRTVLHLAHCLQSSMESQTRHLVLSPRSLGSGLLSYWLADASKT